MKTTYKCNECGTKGTPQQFGTTETETNRPTCPKCGRSDNFSKYVTGTGAKVRPTHVHPDVRFSQDCCGNYFIRVGDKELTFNMNRLSNSQRREVVNGVANILSGVACYMDRTDEEG